ncbi:MAG: hypothetical protein D6683_11970, partial [Actinomyces sp.]
PAERTLEPYRGYGAWVDVFDYSPPYAGDPPPVTPGVVAEMADVGVRTVFVQAARLDERSPRGLEDPWLLAEWLVRGHRAGLSVVGWYLPKWADVAGEADTRRLAALADFTVLGERFDGVAVDIEWTADGLDPLARGERLVVVSARLRAHVGDDPLGAIVLPPVLTEVVNTDYWPEFPWDRLAGLYDVWLPMSYWSFRSERSGYGDGYAYHLESVERLRRDLGDPAAPVHGIGGIGGVDGVDDPPDPPEPLATLDEIEAFAAALADSGSVGGSIYDWRTLEPSVRARVAEMIAGAVQATTSSP